jgi:hypothetical protein
VSFISLRKRGQEPEPDEDLEEFDDAPDDEEQQPERPKKQVGCLGALLLGVCGPGQWLAGRFGTGVAWGVHVVAVWAVGYYGGWVAFGIVTTWLLLVLAFVPREHLDRAAAAVEQFGERRCQPPGEDATEAGEWPASDPLVTVLWRLIAGAPGVHLKTLAEHLQAAAPDQAVDRAQVRAKIDALQIPIRGSVRDAAGRVNEGVHRADLKAWEQGLPRATSDTPSEPRSGPVATAPTCDVANGSESVAMPFSRLLGLWLRGGS